VTGSNPLLDLLDPYVPDDFINEHCNAENDSGVGTQRDANPAARFQPSLCPRVSVVGV
jgi:hypothetical protein